ncbi:TPA: SIR2 family protein [Streptococcus pneumoniae]|nr:SIR2 family protein [Streptococcus pneumoniae]
MNSDQFLKDIQGKNVNFLIGSGASSGLIPTLWIKPIEKSFEELLTSKNYDENQRKVLYFIWFELWIRKTKIFDFNASNKVHNQYKRFVQNLIDFLNNEGFDKPKRVNIFTSNYDTLFEMIFDKLSKENRLTYFNDGSRGFFKKFVSTENYHLKISHSGMSDSFQREIPTINLLKIHGSVTWINSNNEIEVNLENKIFEKLCNSSDKIINLITKFNDNNVSTEDNLLDPKKYEETLLFGSLTEEKLSEKLFRIFEKFSDEVESFYLLYKTFPVVNPTKEKFSDTVFQQHYYQLLRMLSFELEKNDSVLIVFGFSFSDEHILEIVRRSIVNPKLKIYVIAFNEGAKKQIKEKLGNLGGNIIEYLPSISSPDGNEVQGNFSYLNSLFDAKGSDK